MKTLTFALLLLFCGVQISKAQQTLKFNENGKFKIVQFTDIHYKYGNPASDVAIERMNEVLDTEKPDLVFFTGDLIYSKPAGDILKIISDLPSKRKIPFAVLFGNHDDEHDLTRAQLYDVLKIIPYNMTGTIEGLSGVTNFILPIKSSDNKKNAVILYCFDSHSYSKIEGIKGYDYIKFDQIEWYRDNSMEYTKQNDGKPIPSLAFFHIPLPEYNQAASDENAILIGTRKEKACAPDLNSGLFASIKELGDVQATFVGHDHDNDYAVYWKNILLVYGRFTGGNTEYNNLAGGNGARIIELTEGQKGFKSWIRLKNNEVIHRITYPDDFLKK